MRASSQDDEALPEGVSPKPVGDPDAEAREEAARHRSARGDGDVSAVRKPPAAQPAPPPLVRMPLPGAVRRLRSTPLRSGASSWWPREPNTLRCSVFFKSLHLLTTNRRERTRSPWVVGGEAGVGGTQAGPGERGQRTGLRGQAGALSPHVPPGRRARPLPGGAHVPQDSRSFTVPPPPASSPRPAGRGLFVVGQKICGFPFRGLMGRGCPLPAG